MQVVFCEKKKLVDITTIHSHAVTLIFFYRLDKAKYVIGW